MAKVSDQTFEVLDKDKYPSNSITDDKKTPEKVIKGSVTLVKKPIIERLKDHITGGENGKGIVDWMVFDVLIPAAKNMVVDSVQGGIERLMFGESRPNGVRRSDGRSYISYSSISTGRDRDRRDDSRSLDLGNLVFETRIDAEQVLDDLVDYLRRYDQATVRDLKYLIGKTPEWTDEKYGWTSLQDANVIPARRGGSVLSLPRPRGLD